MGKTKFSLKSIGSHSEVILNRFRIGQPELTRKAQLESDLASESAQKSESDLKSESASASAQE